MMAYSARGGRYHHHRNHSGTKKIILRLCLGFLMVATCGAIGYKLLTGRNIPAIASNKVSFDNSVSNDEKILITKILEQQNKKPSSDITIGISTETNLDNLNNALSAYVPVTGLYSDRQKTSLDDLKSNNLNISNHVDDLIANSLAKALDSSFTRHDDSIDPSSSDIFIMSASNLSSSQKLLALDDNYYLDKFNSGAIFRVVKVNGPGKDSLTGTNFNQLASSEKTLKINMTGVTALTRIMMRRLSSVGSPGYFSEEIGPFLADADITHASNEVSFQNGCQYNDAVFCSPPQFIQTLTDSGIDVIELTGNHNNDVGSQYNTETINKYHEVGISTFGGGLNTDEAKKPFDIDKKGSKVTLLGYNYADSPNGGPIASSDHAGANSFDYDKIKEDIAKAHQSSSFAIVDIQFNECYSYPDGYVEFPECNLPISGQEEVFHKIADLGADMVIGTQAHQPQIYELYNGKPIYYGLGNLYFDQTQWPGTERGIILTHYFIAGKHVQTKLTPTVYDKDLQTRKMTDNESAKLFQFLNTSRKGF